MENKKTGKTRREFLKKSISGVTAAAFLPALLKGNKDVVSVSKKDKLILRSLGKTGMKLPVVSMGVMNAENPKLVDAALEKGITYLDTAHVYQRGKNEEMLGKVLKNKKRESFYIATKVPGNFADRKTGLFTERTDPVDFVNKFEISLKRLGLEYVDVLFLHSVVKKEAVMFEPLLNAMLKLKKEGKARFIGVSTHRNEPEVLRAAADSGVHDVVLTAYNFLQPHKIEMNKAIKYASDKGVGIVAMKTQAGVFWERDRKKPINMKAALKWVLQNPNVHTSIPGFTTFDQLDTDLSVMDDLKFSETEKKDLRLDLNEKIAGLYCNQCEECLLQCKEEVDIPTIMRSYMYAFGYRNLALAKDTLNEEGIGIQKCLACDNCIVKCSNGFNIKDKIAEIAGITEIPDQFLV